MKAKRASRAILYVVLTIIALYTLSPLAFLLINSFKTQPEIVSAPLALPSSWDFGHLTGAAEQINFWKALAITALVTLTSVALLVVVSSLSRLDDGQKPYPFFQRSAFDVYRRHAGSVPSGHVSINQPDGKPTAEKPAGLNHHVRRLRFEPFGFFVPRLYQERAPLCGGSCGYRWLQYLQLFFRVVFPLLKSTTVTVIILNAMWIWNDYLLPFLVIGNSDFKTLTLEIYYAKMLSGQYGNPWELIFPAVFRFFHHSYHHRLFISAKILCQGRIRRRSENVEITVP